MNTRQLAALAATGSAAWLMRPDVAACRELIGPDIVTALDRDGADAVLLTLASAALWLVMVWLLLALSVLCACALPGAMGAVAATLGDVIAPGAARRVLAVSLGIGIAVGPAITAAASPSGPPSTGIAAPGWPITAPAWPTFPSPNAPLPAPQLPLTPPAGSGSAEPDGSRPPSAPEPPDPDSSDPDSSDPDSSDPVRSDPAPPDPVRSDPAASDPVTPDPVTSAPAPWDLDASSPGPPDRGSSAQEVVVAVGDSLWSIAAEHLPPGASDADVAAAWPAWHRANAEAIGADPDLIQPGQVLRAPDAP